MHLPKTAWRREAFAPDLQASTRRLGRASTPPYRSICSAKVCLITCIPALGIDIRSTEMAERNQHKRRVDMSRGQPRITLSSRCEVKSFPQSLSICSPRLFRSLSWRAQRQYVVPYLSNRCIICDGKLHEQNNMHFLLLADRSSISRLLAPCLSLSPMLRSTPSM